VRAVSDTTAVTTLLKVGRVDLLAAKEHGRIASVADFLDLLEERGNFCLARRFRGELLQRAKE